MTTLSDFLRVRISVDMDTYRLALDGTERWFVNGPNVLQKLLRECEAKLRIIALHDAWPVLTETETVMEPEPAGHDTHVLALRLAKRIDWMTQREYVRRFGTEPPHAPMLMAMAQVYADHPDFRDEWRLA